MKNVYDQLAKAILQAVLDSVTQLETNREIPGHVLEADLWVEPDPAHAGELEPLGILGRMIALGPCLIEPFSGVPRASEVRSCILEQYSLYHAQCRDAKTGGRSEPAFPRLWVVAHGSPNSVIEDMELRQMKDWPAGCSCGRAFDPFYLIVVRRLPKIPETLLVRLLSRGATLREAMRELARVPETAPALARVAERVMHVLVVFGRELDQDQVEDEDMEALRDIETAYQEWERQVKAEAKAEANRDTLIKTIRSLCLRFDIELTGERLSQLASLDPQQLESVLLEISALHEWPGL